MIKKHLTDYLFLLISFYLFVIGGIGTDRYNSEILSLANGILFIGAKLIQNVSLKVPKYFYLYLLFLLTLFIHCFIFDGKFAYFFMVLSGGLYWFCFYNIKDIASKYFHYFLILTGVAMSIFLFSSHVSGVYFLLEANLFLPTSPLIRHNHIGDLWAIILVLIIYHMSHKVRTWHLVVLPWGLLMVAISQSRSAIAALVSGALYIFYKSNNRNGGKKYFVGMLAMCIVLFIYFGLYKTTLFSRPYFLEALSGLLKFPYGTGIENFSKISTQASFAHNLVLENISGMGIYSIVFILWLIKIGQLLIKNKFNVLYLSIFVALFVNFSFDTTYTIPTMVWIWFTALALI